MVWTGLQLTAMRNSWVLLWRLVRHTARALAVLEGPLCEEKENI
jgi:hypothetical protein